MQFHANVYKIQNIERQRVYVFANLYVWASSGGNHAFRDGIGIFGNGISDKPYKFLLGLGINSDNQNSLIHIVFKLNDSFRMLVKRKRVAQGKCLKNGHCWSGSFMELFSSSCRKNSKEIETNIDNHV